MEGLGRNCARVSGDGKIAGDNFLAEVIGIHGYEAESNRGIGGRE